MDEHLGEIARKLKFSQQKLRDSFPPDIRKQFANEEYVFAHAYGPKRYYILTERRLFIGFISSKGLFNKKFELGVLQHTIDLSRVTSFTTWSELFYDKFDEFAECPFMALQIQTYDRDYDVTVYAFAENSPLHSDPHYFETRLQDVMHHVQNRTTDFEVALWRSPSLPPPLPMS